MSREFALVKSKIRPSNISSIKREFLESICAGYSIRALIAKETFYTVPNSANKLLVSIEALKARLSFLLDPFEFMYFEASDLTQI